MDKEEPELSQEEDIPSDDESREIREDADPPTSTKDRPQSDVERG